jgi:hypothetical protein
MEVGYRMNLEENKYLKEDKMINASGELDVIRDITECSNNRIEEFLIGHIIYADLNITTIDLGRENEVQYTRFRIQTEYGCYLDVELEEPMEVIELQEPPSEMPDDTELTLRLFLNGSTDSMSEFSWVRSGLHTKETSGDYVLYALYKVAQATFHKYTFDSEDL